MGLKISMIEYCKMILKKISFNRRLFLKEYRKSFKYLAPHEHTQFRKWAREIFNSQQ